MGGSKHVLKFKLMSNTFKYGIFIIMFGSILIFCINFDISKFSVKYTTLNIKHIYTRGVINLNYWNVNNIIFFISSSLFSTLNFWEWNFDIQISGACWLWFPHFFWFDHWLQVGKKLDVFSLVVCPDDGVVGSAPDQDGDGDDDQVEGVIECGICKVHHKNSILRDFILNAVESDDKQVANEKLGYDEEKVDRMLIKN